MVAFPTVNRTVKVRVFPEPPKMEKIEMSDTEYLKWLSDYFKKIKDNLEEHIKIVIGEDGSGALYTLQELKQQMKDIITNDNLRHFELRNKMFIDSDWEYYFIP